MKLESLLSIGIAFFVTQSIAGETGKPVGEEALSRNTLLYLQFGREACESCPVVKAMIQVKPIGFFNEYTEMDYLELKFKIGDGLVPFLVTSTPDDKQMSVNRPWPWIIGVDDDLPRIQGPIFVSWALGGKSDDGVLDYFPFRKRMLLK